MAKLQPPRGTRDLFGDELARHRHVARVAEEVARTYGFAEIETPVFEAATVFDRSLGETSDVVSKEMYSFKTREDGELYCLRPENTASVMRAFLSNGMQQQVPARLYYSGPMFRHERPQKGRYRQFYQFGVELVGAASPLADVDVIACGYDILCRLGLEGRVVVKLNTLGDTASRTAFRDALVAYFTAHKDQLSDDSLARLDKNPLRILDSKDAGDRALLPDAPTFDDFLNDESRAFFETVCDGLTRLGVPWERDATLVRGLDYYCHTAFEFVTTDLGAQGTVLGGGRYDGLVELLGGPSVPGVGFASGIDRLSLLLEGMETQADVVALVPVGQAAETYCQTLAHQLRKAGVNIDMAYDGNVGKRMKRANKIAAWASVVIGDEELAAGNANVRLMAAGEQQTVALDNLQQFLTARSNADDLGAR